jgi:hypothetical protein
VVHFDQNRFGRCVSFNDYRRREQIMTIPKTEKHSDKHKEYARFAAHCLSQGDTAGDPDARDIQREMALEWLKLADAILHPPNPLN